LLASGNRWSAGLAHHVVPAAGHQVHYLAGGEGPPVVLLHGIFAEKDHWVDFARPLTNRWRVYAPDLPGYGESGRQPHEPYDYPAQVERLKAWMDAVQLRKVHLAGNSMGGTIAALFAMRYPERVASVAFIGAPHGIRSPQPSTMDRMIDAGQAPLVTHTEQEFEAMLDLVFHRRPFLPFPIVHEARLRAVGAAESDAGMWRQQLPNRWLLQQKLGVWAAETLSNVSTQWRLNR
jgi:pimeloyl-ACP methyl ester carboxylesterase